MYKRGREPYVRAELYDIFLELGRRPMSVCSSEEVNLF